MFSCRKNERDENKKYTYVRLIEIGSFVCIIDLCANNRTAIISVKKPQQCFFDI